MTQARAMGSPRADAYLSLHAKRAGRIKGESRAPGHVDAIDVEHWSWGVSASSAIGAEARTARRSYQHLVVSKAIDTSSTALLSALTTNDELKEASLTMRKAGDGQSDFWRITLKKARVVGVDYDINSHGDPVERVTMSFTEVEVEYRTQESSGIRGAAYTFNDQILPES